MDWDNVIPILIFVGIVVIVIIAIAYNYYAQKKRTEAMTKACEVMGFTFTPVLGKEGMDFFSHFSLFNQGHSRKGRNLMKGKIGETEVILLDYQYTTGSGKHQQTHSQSVVVLPESAEELPDFQLSPESFFHKIGKWFGYKDIDFEENPVFSKRHLLRGPDEPAIRQAFVPEVLDYFSQNQGWSVEVSGGDFLAHRGGKACDTDKCPEFIAEVLTIQRLFAIPEVQPGSEPEANP